MLLKDLISGESKNIEFKETLPKQSIRYMNLIEAWGSGFPKINKNLRSYGLKPLEINYSGNNLRINIYRKFVRQGKENVTQDVTQILKTDKEKLDSDKNNIIEKIIMLIPDNNKISSDKMAEIIGVTSRTIKRYIKSMPNVKYIGSGYSGHWEIIK